MSGYTEERASLHERLIPVVKAELAKRGYPSTLLESSGHRPDAIFDDEKAYWDLKTGRPNLTVEYLSLEEYERIERVEGRFVYIIHANVEHFRAWSVDRVASLRTRQIGGEYTRSGTGSNDTGALFRRGGSPFIESFAYEWELQDVLRR